MKKDTKTKQQLLPEMDKLRTRLDATERRLQETNELCPKHLKISLKEMNAEMEKNSMVNRENRSQNKVLILEK